MVIHRMFRRWSGWSSMGLSPQMFDNFWGIFFSRWWVYPHLRHPHPVWITLHAKLSSDLRNRIWKDKTQAISSSCRSEFRQFGLQGSSSSISEHLIGGCEKTLFTSQWSDCLAIRSEVEKSEVNVFQIRPCNFSNCHRHWDWHLDDHEKCMRCAISIELQYPQSHEQLRWLSPYTFLVLTTLSSSLGIRL